MKEDFKQEDVCDFVVDELNSMITEMQAARNLVQQLSNFSKSDLEEVLKRTLEVSYGSAQLLSLINSCKLRNLSKLHLKPVGYSHPPKEKIQKFAKKIS
jgi:hypothetical protein